MEIIVGNEYQFILTVKFGNKPAYYIGKVTATDHEKIDIIDKKGDPVEIRQSTIASIKPFNKKVDKNVNKPTTAPA